MKKSILFFLVLVPVWGQASQSFIQGDPIEFRGLASQAQSSAWAWCSATARFSSDLLRSQSEKNQQIDQLESVAEASENSIFFLQWWEYEVQLYRKRDSAPSARASHKDTLREFRGIAKGLVEEKLGRMAQQIQNSKFDEPEFKNTILSTLSLCERNVGAMEDYSLVWNGWMAANRAKLSF